MKTLTLLFVLLTGCATHQVYGHVIKIVPGFPSENTETDYETGRVYKVPLNVLVYLQTRSGEIEVCPIMYWQGRTYRPGMFIECSADGKE